MVGYGRISWLGLLGHDELTEFICVIVYKNTAENWLVLRSMLCF